MLVSLTLALLVWLEGTLVLELGGTRLARTSSWMRPLFVACVSAVLLVAPTLNALCALRLVVPLFGYAEQLHRLQQLRSPFSELRSCLLDGATGTPVRPISFLPPEAIETHTIAYYDLSTDPPEDRSDRASALIDALFSRDEQAPVWLLEEDYRRLSGQLERDGEALVGAPSLPPAHEFSGAPVGHNGAWHQRLLVLPDSWQHCAERIEA